MRLRGNSMPLLALFELCKDRRSKKVVIEVLVSSGCVTEEEAHDLIMRLCDAGILTEVHRESQDDDRNIWQRAGWSDALWYHLYSEGLPMADYSKDGADYDFRQMERVLASEQQPPLTLSDSSRPRQSLSVVLGYPHRSLSELFDSPGNYDRAGSALSLQELSWLLSRAFGANGFHVFPQVGKLLRKTVPSGGCRHPLDAFIIPLDGTALENNVYYYEPITHCLETLHATPPEDFVRSLFRPWLCELHQSPKCIVLVSATFPRSMYRYRESRSYRVVYHDLGHLLQNLLFLVRSLDRRILVSYSPPERICEPLVAATGLNVSVIGAALIT